MVMKNVDSRPNDEVQAMATLNWVSHQQEKCHVHLTPVERMVKPPNHPPINHKHPKKHPMIPDPFWKCNLKPPPPTYNCDEPNKNDDRD